MRHPTNQLIDLLDGCLPDSESAKIRSHVDACPECKNELESARSALSAMQSSPPVSERSEVRAAYFSSILPRVRSRIDARSSFQGLSVGETLGRLIAPIGVSVAAVLLLLSVSFNDQAEMSGSYSWTSAVEYMSEYDYPWSGSAADLSELNEEYFLHDIAAVSELPAGLADLNNVDLSGTMSAMTDSEMRSFLAVLDERLAL